MGRKDFHGQERFAVVSGRELDAPVNLRTGAHRCDGGVMNPKTSRILIARGFSRVNPALLSGAGGIKAYLGTDQRDLYFR